MNDFIDGFRLAVGRSDNGYYGCQVIWTYVMNKNILFKLLKSLIIFSVFFVFLSSLGIFDKFSTGQQYYSNLEWDGKDIRDIPERRGVRSVYNVAGTGKTYLVEINSHGLRDHEYAMNKPEGTLRIAAVGDSVTFGAGINLEDTFAKRLEALFGRYCDNKVEVINFGANGASTINELELIQKKVLLYGPDIILLQLDPNDCQILKQIKKNDPFLNKVIIRLKKEDAPLSSWLKHKIELYKFSKYVKSLTPEEEYDNVVKPLNEIIRLCAANKIKLVFFSYDEPNGYSYYPKVLDYIDGLGMPLLRSGMTEFEGVPGSQKYINSALGSHGFPLDAHPNEYGSSIIAEALYIFFKKMPEFVNCLGKES